MEQSDVQGLHQRQPLKNLSKQTAWCSVYILYLFCISSLTVVYPKYMTLHFLHRLMHAHIFFYL